MVVETPITRWQKDITDDSGTKRRCYSVSCPQYRLSSDKSLLPIGYNIKLSNTGVGEAIIDNGGIRSVGVRKEPIKDGDGTYHKIVGIRPDYEQNGNIQVEFTFSRFLIDGANQLDLNSETVYSNGFFDTGLLKIVYGRNLARLLIPITNGHSYRVEYIITSVGVISVDSIDGKFIIKKILENTDLMIMLPTVFDENFRFLGNVGRHFIENISDGVFKYIKEISEEEVDYWINEYGAKWWDTNIYYGTTFDGYVRNLKDPWSTCWSDITGTIASTAETSANIVALWHGTSESFRIDRVFMYFLTSGCPPIKTSTFYGYFSVLNGRSDNTSLFQGTQGATLAVEDFDSFSGLSWGSTGTGTGWKTVEIAKNNINTAGDTLVCLRETDHDVSNVSPNFSQFGITIYTADYSGTTYDPYIEIVLTPQYELPGVHFFATRK